MNIPTDGKMAGSFGWMQQLEGALKGDHRALRKGKLPLEFHASTLPGNRVAVVGAEGYERVNETYRYDVELVSPLPPEVVQPALFGMSASLLMRTPEHDGRLISGLVATLEVAGTADRGLGKDLFRYIVTIVPPLWLWTQRRRNRVFQDKTLPELMKQLLEAEKIDYRFKLDLEKYPKRALYYQRDETDYEFFKRVLADSGVYFLFEHAVQDEGTNSVLSAMGTGAAIAGGVGGALSGFGAAGVGGAMGAAGKLTQDALHTVTRLVLSDAEGGTTPLQDYAAINDAANSAANSAMKAGMGALSGAAKEIKDWAGDGLEAQTGFDMSDELPMDDGSKAAPGDERVYAISYRRNVRPKSVWTLERDHKEPRSWANRNRTKVIETPKLQFDFHLSLGRNGLGVDGGVSADLALDAPTIAPEKLEQELIGHNVGWLAYPSETHRPNGPFVPVEMHEHLKRSLEQLRRDSTVVEVDTDCRRLAAGYRFRLGNHPSGVLNTEYTVTTLRVSAVDPEMLELATDDPRRVRPYIATLEAVPSKDMVPRPPLPETRKHPMELGTVVRWKESADMTTFNRNEVLVRLAWDTDADGNERPNPKSSDQKERDSVLCVPVLQPWAGDGYGLQVTPREGMQVVIGYLDAQNDRPFILGCLHSDTKPPPWQGPEAVKVGFRTQSRWPRGTYEDRAVGRTTGWSEISIDDTGDHEKIHVKAEKDLTVTVGHSRKQRVNGYSSDVVVEDREEVTGGNQNINVGGNQEVTIVGGSTHKIHRSFSSDIVGSVQMSSGGLALLSAQEVHIRAARVLDIQAQTASLHVRGDRHDITLGSSHQTVGTPKAATHHSTTVYGTSSLYATQKLVLRADEGIVLECGTTRLELTPQLLTVLVKTLNLQPTELQMSADSVVVAAKDSMELRSKRVTVFGESASLDLGSTASLLGSSVKLGSGHGGNSKSNTAKEDETFMLTLTVLADDHSPMKSAKYHLVAEGVRYEGSTDGQGVVKEKLPKATTEAALRVWEKDYPGGAARDFLIHIKPVPSATSDEGALLRLRNLGYLTGAIPEDADGQAVLRSSALKRFMEDRGKPSDGTLSEEASNLLHEMGGQS